MAATPWKAIPGGFLQKTDRKANSSAGGRVPQARVPMAATVACSWRLGDWVPRGISTAMCWSCAPVLALTCVIWYVQPKEIYFWPSSCSQCSFLHYCFSLTLQHSIPTGLAAGITTLLPFPPLRLLQLCERSAELGEEGTLKALRLHCSQTQNDHFWTSAASSALCCILVFKAMAMHFVFSTKI